MCRARRMLRSAAAMHVSHGGEREDLGESPSRERLDLTAARRYGRYVRMCRWLEYMCRVQVAGSLLRPSGDSWRAGGRPNCHWSKRKDALSRLAAELSDDSRHGATR